VDDDDDK
jgi:hypothetical protein